MPNPNPVNARTSCSDNAPIKTHSSTHLSRIRTQRNDECRGHHQPSKIRGACGSIFGFVCSLVGASSPLFLILLREGLRLRTLSTRIRLLRPLLISCCSVESRTHCFKLFRTKQVHSRDKKQLHAISKGATGQSANQTPHLDHKGV